MERRDTSVKPRAAPCRGPNGSLGCAEGDRGGPRCGDAGRLVLAGVLLIVLAGCLPLNAPGDVGHIEFVSTSTAGGWKYDYYRNTAYPCAISGYQTFVIGTKVGSSDTTPRPLWAFMHGGGVGYFDADGNPQPERGPEVEESAASLPTTAHRTADSSATSATTPRASAWSRSRTAATTSTRRQHHRPEQPEHDARRQAAHHQRRARDEGCDPVRAEPLPDDEDVPARWERRVRRDVLRRVVDAAPGHPARGRRRRREHREPRSARSRRSRRVSAPTTTIPARVGAIAARVHPDLANIDNEADKLVVERTADRSAACTSGTTATQHVRRRRRCCARCATART